MPPLSRQLTIGLVVSLCIIGAAVATWFTTMRPTDDSLAARLPADAVLAYVEFPAGEFPLLPVLKALAPALELPGIHPQATAIAAVRWNGIDGWVTFRRTTDGTVEIEQTNPALALLLEQDAPSLASDKTFKMLRPEDHAAWVYLAYPRLSSHGSAYASLLTLETPIAVLDKGNDLTIRLPLQPTPHIAPWQRQPMAMFFPQPSPTLVVTLPPWHAMERLGALLTDDARTVAETLARTFVEEVASGLSLQHDIALLLDGPSLLQVATNAYGQRVFSLEGDGQSAGDVDRVLQTIHQHFASAHGTGKIRTVTMKDFTLETLTQEQESSTTERQEGEWAVLETRIGDAALVSARNGRRFVLTTAPDTLFAPTPEEMNIPAAAVLWSPEVAARLQPLWPTLRPADDTVSFQLTNGPGYVEWTVMHAKAI